MGKLIIFTAPSGAGKTTIVQYLLAKFDDLAFSVSATTREKRDSETDGKDYYFLTPDSFRQLIRENAFVEWEEVYENQYYGTLKSEIDRLWKQGKHIIFDIDVKGALNLKQAYPNQSVTVFVKPPSKTDLLQRLKKRKTETPESLNKRMEKAKEELHFENKFDVVLVNDNLEVALNKAEAIVTEFLNSNLHGNPDHQGN